MGGSKPSPPFPPGWTHKASRSCSGGGGRGSFFGLAAVYARPQRADRPGSWIAPIGRRHLAVVVARIGFGFYVSQSQ